MCFIQMCFIISETWKRGAGGGHLDDLLGICLFPFRFIRLWRLKHLKPYAVFAPFVILFTHIPGFTFITQIKLLKRKHSHQLLSSGGWNADERVCGLRSIRFY